MRINIYSEEMTDRVEMVTKTSTNGIIFFGLRFYLKSPPELHHSAEDDDTSAITFWDTSPHPLFLLMERAAKAAG